MIQDYKEINCSLYGGDGGLFSKKKTRYEQYAVLCCYSDKCPLYSIKQCLMATRAGKKCPYGKVEKQYGTGPQAKSYYKLKTETTGKDTYNQLKNTSTRFVIIGDYCCIDTSFGEFWYNKEEDVYKVQSPYSRPYSDYSGDTERAKWKNYGSSHSLEKKYVTTDFLKKLLEFKPYALMGGIIEQYQKEIVPQLKVEILRQCPDIAKELGIESINYVGMQGLLSTLKGPFNFQKGKISFHYDGEFITTEDKKAVNDYTKGGFWVDAIGEPIEVRIKYKPREDLYIQIMDNNWVTSQSVIKSK